MIDKILGVSAGFHDGAVTVVDRNGNIEFASHSERYSKVKNDPNLNVALLADVDLCHIKTIAYYETPWKKQLRQLIAGQGVQRNQLTTHQILKQQIGQFRFRQPEVKTYSHHLSHAAAGFQTSPFARATVVVIDAIGELDTISIWGAEYDDAGYAKYTPLWRQRYPHSIGLFYTAMTQHVGLKPMEDEYILMGMAAYGKPNFTDVLRKRFLVSGSDLQFSMNLHIGIPEDSLNPAINEFDLAASAQTLTESLINIVMQKARSFGWSDNLVYMGGVALNCSANANLGYQFDDIWIMPNPGDAGSSLGAAALAYGKKLNWIDAYLGHEIPGDYPVDDLLSELLTNKIVGVASGRAEFGPRALGNRSLLADPRGPDIKDKVNEIKKRQKFRPFAPAIMEEFADQYFSIPRGWSNSRYMQVVSECRSPDLFPAIVHADGTSRVQTVPRGRTGIRQLLEKWFVMTGCPMLLNTSLNVKGEPMVNDRSDADRFQQLYGVRVCS
jgi:carbamoyltransferase